MEKEDDSDLPDSVHIWKEPGSIPFCERNPNHPSCIRIQKIKKSWGKR